MTSIDEFAGQFTDVEISGGKLITGRLVAYGRDMVIVCVYDRFYHIPLVHVQCVKKTTPPCTGIDNPGDPLPDSPIGSTDNVSFRKTLFNAKGHFVELYVSGNTTLHGYLTSVMNDFFVFHSPVYKTIFVSLNHLKWLIPYPSEITPYALNADAIPHYPLQSSLSRTFNEQCKKLEGNLVVFDMGDNPDKTGLLESVDLKSNIVHLWAANGTRIYWNLHHLKTVYIP